MHPALATPDVLFCLVSHVDSNDTLAALAQTSSVVSEFALDRLWNSIDSLVLLARCMPPAAWDEEETYTPLHREPGTFEFECANGAPVGTYSSQIVSGDMGPLAALRRLIHSHSPCPRPREKVIGLGHDSERT
jgi:hypothetical protein